MSSFLAIGQNASSFPTTDLYERMPDEWFMANRILALLNTDGGIIRVITGSSDDVQELISFFNSSTVTPCEWVKSDIAVHSSSNCNQIIYYVNEASEKVQIEILVPALTWGDLAFFTPKETVIPSELLYEPEPSYLLKGLGDFQVEKWFGRLRKFHDLSDFKYSHESFTVREGKFDLGPHSNAIFAEVLDAYVFPPYWISHFSEVFLNSQRSSDPVIYGMHDQDCIGLVLPADLPKGLEGTLKLSMIFPRLKPSDFVVTKMKLEVPASQQWYMATTESAELVCHCLILSDGRAQVFYADSYSNSWYDNDIERGIYIDQETKNRLDDPCFPSSKYPDKVVSSTSKLRNLDWKPIDDEDFPFPILPRYLVQIKLRRKSKKVYFRTTETAIEIVPNPTELNRLRIRCPSEHGNLSPEQIWLRSRMSSPFSRSIIELLQCEMTPKVFLSRRGGEQNMIGSILHYTNNKAHIPNDAFRDELTFPTELFKDPSRPIVVISDLTLTAYRPLQSLLETFDLPELVPRVILVLLAEYDYKEPTSAIKQAVNLLWRRTRQLEVDLVDVRLQTTQRSINISELPNSVVIPRWCSHQMLLGEVKRWISTSTFRPPPPWELLHSELFPIPKIVRHISDMLTECWSSGGSVEIITLRKRTPSSGATFALRAASFKQLHCATILWISSINEFATTSEICKQFQPYLEKEMNILVCSDELPCTVSNTFETALNDIKCNKKIVWLRVVSENGSLHSSSSDLLMSHRSVTIDGILDEDDFTDVVNRLSKLEPASENLRRVASAIALAPNSPSYNRHIIALSMASIGRIDDSIDTWIEKIYNQFASFPALINVALGVAVICSWSQSMSTRELSIFDVRAWDWEKFLIPFEQLFPPNKLLCRLYDRLNWCLHPILAKLFLYRHYGIKWNDQPPFENFVDMWKMACYPVSERNKRYSKSLDLMLKECQDNQPHSPFVSDFLQAKTLGLQSSVNGKTTNSNKMTIRDYFSISDTGLITFKMAKIFGQNRLKSETFLSLFNYVDMPYEAVWD